jgi:hypothetical protein
MIFLGCTSSIVYSCALQDWGALLSSKFGSKMLLLTSDWPHHHCRLGILFADLNIHPSAPACSCTPSAPLYTNSLCLHADPLGVENLPPGFLAAERKHRWLDPLATTACFLRSSALLSLTRLLPLLVPPLALQAPLSP